MPVGRCISGSLRCCRQETSSVSSHQVTICTEDNDHAGVEKFRGCWPSHLEQFTSRSASRNSLLSDVRSTFEGPPVWLMGSASEDYLWRALQIHSSSSSSITWWHSQWPWVTWRWFRPLEMLGLASMSKCGTLIWPEVLCEHLSITQISSRWKNCTVRCIAANVLHTNKVDA